MCSEKLYDLSIVPNYPGEELTVVDCISPETLLSYLDYLYWRGRFHQMTVRLSVGI